MIKYIIFLFFILGCEKELGMNYSISYFKDYKTNICFAIYLGSISAVPCSKEVEELIQNK